MESIIEKCLYSHLEESIARVLGIPVEEAKRLRDEGRMKLSKTPDPKIGDYGIALHIFLKNIPRNNWTVIGEELIKDLTSHGFKETCKVLDVYFVNGYLNIRLDYSTIISTLLEDFLRGNYKTKLYSIGQGKTIIVEHTSANPVHPLHIGSGRNSVVGDTFSRLSRKLGFNVLTRFYVNDLGRQVAVLAYAVSKLRKNNIHPDPSVKTDHWYGIVYASANVIMMIRKLSAELTAVEKSFFKALKDFAREYESAISSNPDLRTRLETFIKYEYLVHDPVRTLSKFSREFKLLMKTQDSSSKKTIESLLKKVKPLLDNFKEIYKEYLSYIRAAKTLQVLNHVVYSTLEKEIVSYEAAEEEIKTIMVKSERGDPEALNLVKQVSNEVLRGFRETLENYGIFFDGFDFESDKDVVELAQNVVEKLLSTRYVNIVDGAVELDLNKAAEEIEYVRTLFAPDSPGRFIVRRSDGTTLYVTRDIAYSILKFSRFGAEKVYNVIAIEQERAQKQLRAALKILGYDKEAENLIHFAYEMVQLKHMRMSGRRGTYYTMDELLIDMEKAIVEKQLDQAIRDKTKGEDIASLYHAIKGLAVANARTLLLSVEPGKVLYFDPDRIREFEHGTTIIYSFVRLGSILRKQWSLEPFESLETLKNMLLSEIMANGISGPIVNEEKNIIELLSSFTDTLRIAYEEMKPNKVLEYALSLSQELNKFYEKCNVIGERDVKLKNLRLLLVLSSFMVLLELLDVLGLPRLRKL
ncbi:MAG: arginine--tRNA ligase [Thermosphaera sp.]